MTYSILKRLRNGMIYRKKFSKIMQDLKRAEDPILLGQFIRHKAHSLDLALKRGEKNYKNIVNPLRTCINIYKNKKYDEEDFICWAQNIILQSNGDKKEESELKFEDANSLDEIIKKRKSIRKFKQHNVPKELILKLIEMGIHAPNACNKQSVRFLIGIRENGSMRGIRSKKDFGLIEIPPVIIYIVNDDRYYFEKESALMTIGCIAENIVLKATELCLGTCLVHVVRLNRDRLRKQLNLNDYESVYLLICLGYPNENPIKPPRRDTKKIISFV